jgi:Transport and Golgi organisation 2
MCTVTVMPSRSGVRIACNRDELRLRPQALPPQVRRCGDRQAVFPIDPVSSGTWIAATNAGLCYVLLNVNEAEPPRRSSTPTCRSRGEIIRMLCCADDLDAALLGAASFEFAQFAPFRLVLLDVQRHAELYWNGREARFRSPSTIERPLLFTSSGLGDAIVESPRRALFESCFQTTSSRRARQLKFHRHTWPGGEDRSVWMTRSDALTVNLTIVDIIGKRVRMAYLRRIGESRELSRCHRVSLQLVGANCHATC